MGFFKNTGNDIPLGTIVNIGHDIHDIRVMASIDGKKKMWSLFELIDEPCARIIWIDGRQHDIDELIGRHITDVEVLCEAILRSQCVRYTRGELMPLYIPHQTHTISYIRKFPVPLTCHNGFGPTVTGSLECMRMESHEITLEYNGIKVGPFVGWYGNSRNTCATLLQDDNIKETTLKLIRYCHYLHDKRDAFKFFDRNYKYGSYDASLSSAVDGAIFFL